MFLAERFTAYSSVSFTAYCCYLQCHSAKKAGKQYHQRELKKKKEVEAGTNVMELQLRVCYHMYKRVITDYIRRKTSCAFIKQSR